MLVGENALPWFNDPHIITNVIGFIFTAVIIMLTRWKTQAELKLQEAKLATALAEHNNKVENALSVNQTTTEKASAAADANSGKLDVLLDRTKLQPSLIVVKEETHEPQSTNVSGN